MPRRLHLFNDQLPAYEHVIVTSTVEREEFDPQYLVVRPVERIETKTFCVPFGAHDRQSKLLFDASQALQNDFRRRELEAEEARNAAR